MKNNIATLKQDTVAIELWMKITKKFKEEEEKEYSLKHSIWLDNVKPIFFCQNKNILSLYVSDNYFKNEIEKRYKSILERISSQMECKPISMTFQIDEEVFEERLDQKSTMIALSPVNTKLPKTKWKKNLSPYFQNHAEFRFCSCSSNKYKQLKKAKKQPTVNPMLIPYGSTNIVCANIFDEKFFTHPSDKRKKAKTEIKIQFKDGTHKIYDLYRGQLELDDIGIGQLNTSHAKVLLAIIYIWQEKGCKFKDKNGFLATIDISIRELTKKLNLKPSGITFKNLRKKIEELYHFPNLLHNNKYKFAFSFILRTDILQKKDSKFEILRITLHPFISKQLYDRKVFLRNPSILLLDNPISIKLLLYMDKALSKGNKLRYEITELAKNLELPSKRHDNLIRSFQTAIKELNGYKIREEYAIKVKLQKKSNRVYYVNAELEKYKYLQENSQSNNIVTIN
jgi:hypothetical protein